MTTENRLIANLPGEVYEKLAPNLKRVSLQQGTILHHPGQTIESVHFPIDCLLSMTVTHSDGHREEAGMIGNREVIGVNAFMGGRETTQTKYIVQMAGSAIKADAQPLEEFDRNKELRDVLLSSGQYASNSCTEELSKEQMNQTKDAPPTILMIELDDDTRPILKHNLRNWGYWVIEALQEEDAVALARGVRDCPGLILIDQVELSIDDFLNMGQRIRQGAELSSRPPIVVMAEQYGEDMEDKDVQVGESEYVTYLEDGEQLRSLLHRLCPV